MKLYRFLLAGTVISIVGVAFAYHHLEINPKPIQANSALNATPAKPMPTANAAVDAIEKSLPATSPAQMQVLMELVNQVIGDAIQRGTLDPNRLTPQQLALLPEKYRKKNNNEPQLNADEIAHIEQQLALGDDAPPDPTPQLPCPDPNNLPENYNNAYNKMILRERGCKI
jgi:hypothetical protein